MDPARRHPLASMNARPPAATYDPRTPGLLGPPPWSRSPSPLSPASYESYIEPYRDLLPARRDAPRDSRPADPHPAPREPRSQPPAPRRVEFAPRREQTPAPPGRAERERARRARQQARRAELRAERVAARAERARLDAEARRAALFGAGARRDRERDRSRSRDRSPDRGRWSAERRGQNYETLASPDADDICGPPRAYWPAAPASAEQVDEIVRVGEAAIAVDGRPALRVVPYGRRFAVACYEPEPTRDHDARRAAAGVYAAALAALPTRGDAAFAAALARVAELHFGPRDPPSR